MPTKVQVSLFKPTGFEDTYVASHDDRWLAAKDALAKYPDSMLDCLNSVVCNRIGQDEMDRLLARQAAWLLPNKPNIA